MLFTDAAYVVAGMQDETVPMAAVDAMKQVYQHYGTSGLTFHEMDIGHDFAAAQPIEGLKAVMTQQAMA